MSLAESPKQAPNTGPVGDAAAVKIHVPPEDRVRTGESFKGVVDALRRSPLVGVDLDWRPPVAKSDAD